MKNFKVIKSNQEEWQSTLSKSLFYDFYHTKSYNLLETEGEPVLLVASIYTNFLAFPLIIREIPETNYFDCTSVYGYSGPISNLPNEYIDEELKIYFKECMIEYFQQNNIVSCFSRLHPIFENSDVLKNFGKVISINKTIAIDLTLPIEDQRKKYRKSNKYEINRLKKNNFIVKIADTEEEINAFIDIYTETMKRVNASQSYFFDNEYFHSLLKNSCFDSKLLLAKKEEQITAGAIFTITNKLMQYHLAGTKSEFIRDTPMKLIIDEARLLANKQDLEYLHLGGGVGGSDEDSLYKFKAGFSDNNFTFKVWQYIANKEIYTKLVTQKNIDRNSSFFPLYRT